MDGGRWAAWGHCGCILLYDIHAQHQDQGVQGQLSLFCPSQYLNTGLTSNKEKCLPAQQYN